VTRFLYNPLFWAIVIILAWLITITMSIASNPAGARAQTLPTQQEISQH
jgi:hypothetical protein